ncbi:MAG TPA: glutathione S-transferase [Oceanospirillales bacterium]|nr:glutathione S-transferase [Oceanospirillaceae bacterium]MAR01968.1 glutathione S-transferase [Oceanospirillaceae bacterium]HBS42638.1 glutathione S-transferase [Oceanospirillales bacterium]|tara:strand:+ start:337 stop:1086 length:750 start_codon:yes stop_codon:yes gene_type:complete
MNELVLYQFPVSHFCEKVRWALDFKGLEYRTVNLLPGAHIKTIRAIAPQTTVPLLKHGDKIIQGSAAIIDYLDELQPQPSLTPEDDMAAKQARQQEALYDTQLGPATRLYSYHYLLDKPSLAVPLLTFGHSLPMKIVFRIFFFKIAQIMRAKMRINDTTAAAAEQTINQHLEEIASVYADGQFLVGDQLTRADLAACAFLAPTFMPVEYGIDWPDISRFPLEMRDWLAAHQEQVNVVGAVYRANRRKNA